MPKKSSQVLSREDVSDLLGRLPVATTVRLRDAKSPGLLLSAYAGRTKAVWEYFYRDGSGKGRVIKIGDAGSLSLPDARVAAKALAGRCALGADPLADKRRERIEATTVAMAWATYRERRWPSWKPRTRETYSDLAARMIEPHLGKVPVAKLTTANVARWHHKLTEAHGGVTANRSHALLRGLLNWWTTVEMPGAVNPCRGVKRNKESRRVLRLSLHDVAHLWLALDDLVTLGPARAGKRIGESQGQGGKGQREATPRGLSLYQATLLKLLAVTGCRASEVRTLQWQDVRLDDGLLALRDAKTGPRDVLVPRIGVELLRALGPAKSGPVFRSHDGGQIAETRKAWARACKLAGLDGRGTPHHLRHFLGTLVVVAGGSPLDASRVLGHSLAAGGNATSAYLHTDDARARTALESAVALILAAVEKARSERAAKAAVVVEMASA